MNGEKKEEMEFVVQTLYQHTLARGKVEINSSVQGLKDWGEMRSAGFRPGSDKGRKMGVTALNAKTGKNKELIFEDQERMLDLALINETLAEWMSTLCMHAFKSNRDLAIKHEIPSFADIDWSKSPNANIFASSVVVTRDGFNNNPHNDRDVSAYTYGIFTRINRITGLLHCDETSDYLGYTTGTYFILDEYHVELALDLCDGVVESIWASDENHHTSASTTYEEGHISIAPKYSPITRFGCSLQINESLLNRIEGLLKMREGKTPQEWELYKKEVVKCYEQEIDFKLSKL
ncbi:uncharacterized protein MELLADRAFT_84333 [Melampsora larici-populina 98AG31]|uniref:Tet-like 2OG-Fe(II) oxygenase domain-containing protein n=1 Tax=Melampsora larici-populina (strain 98AG31 / pathotype 3-4-7) TaxID=747676 RepID=F4RFD2_MELLP|nr:uncharacterized protein MELLADRAFT_84333 [Melampsora larici-populina 98AG31]EGG08958.1 hypothetical protein MELLADRAFT_84333 [Melampsora larici-populina 98AG31]